MNATTAAAFDNNGYRSGTRYVELSGYDGRTVFDEARATELEVTGVITLIGNGDYDGVCVRLQGPGGWYLAIPEKTWIKFGFALPAEVA